MHLAVMVIIQPKLMRRTLREDEGLRRELGESRESCAEGVPAWFLGCLRAKECGPRSKWSSDARKGRRIPRAWVFANPGDGETGGIPSREIALDQSPPGRKGPGVHWAWSMNSLEPVLRQINLLAASPLEGDREFPRQRMDGYGRFLDRVWKACQH